MKRALSVIIRFLSVKIILGLLAILVIGIPLLYLTVLNQKEVKAWFDENWLYRIPVPISAHTAAESNVFITVTLDTATPITAGKMQSDCGDLRFTKENGELLPYFINASPGCNNAATTIQVNFDSFPAGAQTIYYYYGNASAPNGFNSAAFATAATGATIGTLGSETQGPGPIGYWKFDDGTGTNAQDSSSSNNDGTLSGTTKPTWQTENQCIYGKCLFFNGSTSKVTGSKIATGIQTVSFWVRPNTIATQGILDLDGGTHKISTNASGVISATGFSSPTYYINGVVQATPTLVLNQWNHVAITTATGFNSTNSFTIGTDGTNFINGFIDEVKFYPYARSKTQILTDYKGGSSRIGTSVQIGPQNQWLSEGLVGYWKMDETSGTSIADASGNSNTGTLTSAQETGSADNTTDSTTSVLVGTNNTNLGTTDDMYNNMVLRITGAVESQTCNITTGFERIISDYVGSTKAITVQKVFSAETDNCTFEIRHQAAGKFGGGLTFDGVNDNATVANTISGTQTIAFWINPVSTTGGLIDLNGSAYLTVSSGTISATGFTSATIYVNGAVSSTLSANSWQHVVVTDTSGISASAIVFAKANNSYLSGRLDDVRFYNRALSPKEVSDLYNWAPGPVAYWNFDEKTGTSANDTSGNSNTGTLGGGTAANRPTWSKGKYGGALNFDGSNDSVVANDNTSLTLNKALTLEAWINPTSLANTPRIISKRTGTPIPWEFIIETSGQVSFGSYETSWWIYDSTAGSTITTNSWQHIAVTFDSGTIKYYKNGILIRTSTGNPAILPITTANVTIGVWATTSNPFQGLMDELRVYNYARTAKQIVEDMNAGHPAVGTPVGSAVGHWKFDEGQGTTANDSTPNANNLTLSSASWTDSGKFGKAWNGTGALWLSRADDADFDFSATDDFAISLWYKSDSANNPGAAEYLLNKGPIAASAAGYAIYANTSGNLCFGIDDDTTWNPDITSCTSTDVYDGNWHHVLGVRDTVSDKTYIYIDGVLKDSDTDTTSATLANSSSLYIGDSNGADGGDEFNGDVDEVKIYRFSLTADQVKTEFNRGQSMQLGALGDNSTYQKGAANQEYCVPGDATSCAAPVGRWNFEEGSGTSTNDTSGGGSTGTITGATYNSGKQGKALNFNGSTDTVTVSNSLSAKTIEFWVNPSTTTQNLIDLRTAATAANISVSSGTISATGFTSPTYYVNGVQTASPTLTANTWQHVAITTNTAITANAIAFGRISSTSLTGKLDSIRIFDYARSAAQVAYDYNRGAPVGWWKMDECQGTTLHDSSGNGNNGAWQGGTAAGTCTTSSTAWGSGATGKRNASLSYNGTNDYATIPSSSILTPGTADFTYAAWVKSSGGTQADPIILEKYSATNDVARLALTHTAGASNPEYPEFWVRDTGGHQADAISAKNTNDGAWHHIVGVRTSSNIYLYVDGILSKTVSASSVTTINPSNPIYIGNFTTTQNQSWRGQIDDVRIYNYALTATQVKDVMNQGAVFFGPSTGSP